MLQILLQENIQSFLTDKSSIVINQTLLIIQKNIQLITDDYLLPEINKLLFSKNQHICLNALSILITYSKQKNNHFEMTEMIINHLLQLSEKCEIIELTKMISLMKQCTIQSSILNERIISTIEKYLDSFDIALTIETSELLLYLCESSIKQLPFTRNILKKIEYSLLQLYNHHCSDGSIKICLIFNCILSIAQRYQSFCLNNKVFIPEINDSEDVIRLKMNCISYCYSIDGLQQALKQMKYILLDSSMIQLLYHSLVSIGESSKEKAICILSFLNELISIPLRQQMHFIYFEMISHLIVFYKEVIVNTTDYLQQIIYYFEDDESFEIGFEEFTEDCLYYLMIISSEISNCFSLKVFTYVFNNYNQLSLKNKMMLVNCSLKIHFINSEYDTFCKEIISTCLSDKLLIDKHSYINEIELVFQNDCDEVKNQLYELHH